MNCHEIENILEDELNGELSLTQLAAMEQHLRDCPACAAKRKQDAAWLAVLTTSEADANDDAAGRDATAFTQAVLDQWQPAQTASRPVQTQPPHRLPRSRTMTHRFTLYVGVGALAAAIALALLVDLKMPTSRHGQPQDLTPVSAMARQFTNEALVQPQRLLSGMHQTSRLLAWRPDPAMLLPAGIPDPAQFISPRQQPDDRTLNHLPQQPHKQPNHHGDPL